MSCKSVTPTYDHNRASRDVRAVIDDRGDWDWSLQVNEDGSVYGIKQVPYDGQRYIRGQPETVVREYVDRSGTPHSEGALRDAVAAALNEDGR